jgi:hypothetical protein
MVSSEKGLPMEIDPGKKYGPKAAPKIAGRLRPNAEEANAGPGAEDIDMSTTKNCLWVAKLGSQTYGTPMIASGQVYVGTNNESPRNNKHIGDRGIVMVFDEYTGQFKWQMVSPKMGSGKVNDWEYLGVCASPTIVGDKAYVPGNRCQIICIDVNGMSNGNQGMQDEAAFMAAPDKYGKPMPTSCGCMICTKSSVFSSTTPPLVIRSSLVTNSSPPPATEWTGRTLTFLRPRLLASSC